MTQIDINIPKRSDYMGTDYWQNNQNKHNIEGDKDNGRKSIRKR